MEVKLDQHLLDSKNVLLLEKNSSNINKNDIIFEIGPADGRLSEFLLQANPQKLISVEMDSNFKDRLENIKKEYKDKFEYKIGNGLEEIETIKFNKLISNIPYSITEPLYSKICELKIPFVILLHGNTFFNILIDDTCMWHYYINSFYTIDKILDIAGNAFNPPAKTMSVLIKLEIKKKEILTQKEKLLQILFSKRDRNTKNALIFSLVDLGKSKKESKEIIKELELSQRIENTKFSNISNNEFINILNFLITKLNY